MEIFNIGFGELFFIILIALIVLGPREMTKAARTLGQAMRRIIRSPMWTEIVTTSRQIRDLPNKIIREANLEESLEEVKQTAREIQTEIKQIDQEGRSISDEIQGEINPEMNQIGLEDHRISNEIDPRRAEGKSGLDEANPPSNPSDNEGGEPQIRN
jgi:sec-independent protein translocase protein TatB